MKKIRLAGSMAAVAVMGLAIRHRRRHEEEAPRDWRGEGLPPRGGHPRDGDDRQAGRDTGLWDTVIRTDTEALTKKKLEYNAKNLNDFDAIVFYTGGTLEMDDQKRADFLSAIRDDGKGFVGIHSATITFTSWPDYGEMIGGYYDEHPWNTFDAPVVVEDPAFPA